MPRRFSQLADATWDVGVLLLTEAVGLELGWLGVADLAGPQVRLTLAPTLSSTLAPTQISPCPYAIDRAASSGLHEQESCYVCICDLALTDRASCST